ncbi:hypothetical protein LTR36_006441 [Oleoguttula mirabilis]|uniref:Uncharacterized protein n=1 Tax=Oleoguttula mirabilis TaxID=1507867 RepID=A0AAV9JV24_9PEZI|nr:hypothetical protein LTR36_006441 [Oleoguttula mirabilis]
MSKTASSGSEFRMELSRPEWRATVTPWTSDGDSEAYPTDGAPKLVLLKDGSLVRVAVLPDVSLMNQIQEAVIESRAVNRAEDYSDVRLDRLFDLRDSVQRKISDAEAAIAELEGTDTVEAQIKCQNMRKILAKLRWQLAQVEEEQRAYHQDLESQRGAQRYNLLRILGVFESALIDSNVLQHPDSEEGGDKADQGYSEAESPLLGGNDSESRSESSESNVSGFHSPDSGVLPHKPDVSDLSAYETADETLIEHEGLQDSAEKANLIRQFQSMQTRLEVVEQTFEKREARFDREAEERHRKLNAGDREGVASDLAFDMHQLQTTRHMARQIVEAEEALEAAKSAAVAAGIQLPGSDIESGFVDDVNDGYRISWEEDAAGTVNPQGIIKWLQGVSDEITEEPAEAAIDDWDAESVDISDSASMVADGPARKRIDKWRAACASVVPSSVA